jgi:hypothetical protein
MTDDFLRDEAEPDPNGQSGEIPELFSTQSKSGQALQLMPTPQMPKKRKHVAGPLARPSGTPAKKKQVRGDH